MTFDLTIQIGLAFAYSDAAVHSFLSGKRHEGYREAVIAMFYASVAAVENSAVILSLLSVLDQIPMPL